MGDDAVAEIPVTRRDLSTKDSALVCLLLTSFAGYLTPNVGNLAVLGA